jgi:uncharacterized UBP type Zn finger protein
MSFERSIPAPWLDSLAPGHGCRHVDQIALTLDRATRHVCADCGAGRDSAALSQCMICGNVACGDDTPGRHAERHFRETGHAVTRSLVAGEHWFWCYVDQVAFRLS